MINGLQNDQCLGMRESWEKLEFSGQMKSVYQCIKEFISETEVGIKFIGTRVWQTRVPFKKKIYRARITETGGVGSVACLEVEHGILEFQ